MKNVATKDPKSTPGASMPRAEKLLGEYKSLKGGRSNFESYWQTLHDYFYIESQDINTSQHPGSELTVDYLYDSTTLECSDILASGFMNYLTPPTSKWFSLKAKNPRLKDNKRVSIYLEEVVEQVNYTLNESNFYNTIYNNYKGSGVYGTSGALAEEDDKDDAVYYSIPIKNVCLKEDSRGRVIAYFLEFEYTSEQAAGKWGRDKLSDKMQEELDLDIPSTTKHPFVLYIAERFVRDVRRRDKSNLPIEATWLDVGGKKIVDEGGYHEMPAFCHRFNKRQSIPWGYSPAMKALPFARILNAAAKTNLRAMMKHTDPPLAMPNNAFLMPLNMNPRAVNYYNPRNMPGGGKDIYPFGNTGDPKAGMLAIEYYTDKVRSIMYADTFLAFDKITKQMNNPEIMERINEKMTMLGPAVGRYISEFLNPIIVRTIGILSRKGKLPEAPEEFALAPEYEIDIISQLAQAQRRSELNSLMTGLTLVGQMAQVSPDVLDKVNSDKVVDTAWDIIGAPQKVLRNDEELGDLRESKAKMAQQQIQMNQMEQGAKIVKDAADVDLKEANAEAAGKK